MLWEEENRIPSSREPGGNTADTPGQLLGIKMYWQKYVCRFSAQMTQWGYVLSSCSHGHEPTNSMKCGRIYWKIKQLWAPQGKLRPMEFVSWQNLLICIFFGATAPHWAGDSAFTRSLDHTRRTTVGTTLWTNDQLVTETSTWQHTTLTTDSHAHAGYRTHNLSRRATADIRVKPRGNWDRQVCSSAPKNVNITYVITNVRNTEFLRQDTYEGHLESKERFAIERYLLIIGKKQNMQILSHTFSYFST